jgi:RNA polymerase sigma factor (sigma-70 family)
VQEEFEILIENYKNGDTVSFGKFFELNKVFVLGICAKYCKEKDTASDWCMEIFEKLMTDIKRFKIENYRSWLYVYSKNYCLMAIKKTPETKKIDDFMENRLSFHPYDNDEKENMFVSLENNLELLNDEQKVCVKLFYLEKKSYQEISTLLKYDLNKVKSFIQNGKRNLLIKMKQENEE